MIISFADEKIVPDPQDTQDPQDHETSAIADVMIGDEPSVFDVSSLVKHDGTSHKKELIVEYLRQRQAEGYSMNAIKWANQALLSQINHQIDLQDNLPVHLNSSNSWLGQVIKEVMYWIDDANIPLSHPDLKSFQNAVKVAQKWNEQKDLEEKAKQSPITDKDIVHRFPDGGMVVRVNKDNLELENSFFQGSDFYLTKSGNNIFSFKDPQQATKAMISTMGDVTDENIEIDQANNNDVKGINYIQEWVKTLRSQGHIVSSVMEEGGSNPSNARELREYLEDEYGFPIKYGNWGGDSKAYSKQISEVMSECDVYDYGQNRRACDAIETIVQYAKSHGQLKELEDGLQLADEKCWLNFLDWGDEGMQHKYPHEEDFSDPEEYEKAREAYEEERNEIEAESGWRKFLNLFHDSIQGAKTSVEKEEKIRAKAWAGSKRKIDLDKKRKLEEEQGEYIADQLEKMVTANSWYLKSDRITVSEEKWKAMLRG